jgi:Domain of unknown function (DU1801)
MLQRKAKTVAEYLAELPADRRVAIEAVRRVILKNLDKDFEEGMQYGMIGYSVPHRIFPAGYHCDPRQPLPFAALASQKNYMSLYLMCIYGDPTQLKRLQRASDKSGKKLDMGKSCIRFKKLEELPLDVIADAIGRVRAASYIEHCERAVQRRREGKTAKPKRASKPTPAQKPKTKRSAKKSARLTHAR